MFLPQVQGTPLPRPWEAIPVPAAYDQDTRCPAFTLSPLDWTMIPQLTLATR